MLVTSPMLVSQSTMALAAGTPVPRTSARLVRVIGACAPMRCRAINCPSGIPLPAQATGLAPTAARRRLWLEDFAGLNLGQMQASADGAYVYFPWMVYRGRPITAFCNEERLTIRQRSF